MIKIILFDCDGPVVIRESYFTHRLVKKHTDITLEKVWPFFENKFQECLVGKADLKQELAKVLSHWGYKGTVEEIIKFWFENEADINKPLLDYVKKFRAEGIKCYLATNNEKYRVDYLLNTLGLGPNFDGCFASGDLGCLKPQKEFWEEIQKNFVGVKPDEVLFWDDDIKNVESGKNFGYNSEFYEKFDGFEKVMKNKYQLL